MSVRSGIAALAAVLMVLTVTLLGGATASAHTGFESSTPSDGATVDAPVELITIVFTGEATPVGDEFIALTPAGVVQEPVSVETLDNMVFSLRFDPPLTGGQVALRWNVQAADSHPIEGAFSFAVDAPAPTTVAATAPATSVPPTTEPASTPITTDTPATTDAPTATATPSDADAVAEVDAAVVVAGGESATPPPAGDDAVSTRSLDEFLAVDNTRPGETTATVGRLIGLLGVALGLGAFAFVATALRGRRDEIRRVLTAVRVLGIVIAVGATIEYVGVGRIAGESLASTWSTSPGFATVLRIVGGVGLAIGLAGAARRGSAQRSARTLSAAVTDDLAAAPVGSEFGSPFVRWSPGAAAWPALGGVGLVIVSFWFDGHTVSKGFRPLHALVNSVHVAAGAVWVGGVVTLAVVVWSRHRSGDPTRVAELVVRFSKIATIALVAVVLAGGIMAILVLDSFGELTGTPWGKILLLKTAAVGLAAIGGAYNHFRLLPALDADPESPALLAELRSTVTAEAMLLTFVVIVTAWLVAAAS